MPLTSRLHALWPTFALFAVGLGPGCARVTNPPPASGFVSRGAISVISQVTAEMGRAAEWQARSASTGSSSGNGRMQAHADEEGTLRCAPAELDKFLAALKARMLESARQGGMTPMEAQDIGGGGRGFRFAYAGAGGVHGTASVDLQPAESKGDKTSYTVKLHVEEAFP